MNHYKIVYTEDATQDEGCYGISIVDRPANQMEFMMFSDKTPIKLSSEVEKKVLTGVVLIPGQIIERISPNGEKYTIEFPAEVVELLSQDFLKRGHQLNSTYNHDENKWLKGISVIESWIVTDPNNDKSNALGFKNIVPGTWMVSMKLSDELWEDYIKTGLAKGFSIDSYVAFEKINLNKQSKPITKTMKLLQSIINLLSQAEDVKLASIEVTDLGTLTADAFEPGNVVYQELNGEMLPLLDATFEYEGNTYTTDAEGKITEVKPLELPESEIEVELEQIPEDMLAEIEALAKSLMDETSKPIEEVDVEALQKEIEDLKLQLENIMKEKEAVLMEVAKLSAKPIDTKLKSNANSNRKTESTMEALARIAKSK